MCASSKKAYIVRLMLYNIEVKLFLIYYYMNNKIIISLVIVAALAGGIYIIMQPQKTAAPEKVSQPNVPAVVTPTATTTKTVPAQTTTAPKPVITAPVTVPKAPVVTPTSPAPVTTAPVTPVSTVTTATMAEVATHNSEASCWSVIDTSIYDLTEWISKHPGGSRNIIKICGIDGTAAFVREHGSSKKAAAALENYYYGEVK